MNKFVLIAIIIFDLLCLLPILEVKLKGTINASKK